MAPRLGLVASICALVAVAAAAPLPAVARLDSQARAAACPPVVKPPPEQAITRPGWLTGVLITEYYPAPERWFGGRRIPAAGLPGLHRVDWLYSARGLAMQGEGIGADGHVYRFSGPYSLTWRNLHGNATYPCANVPGAWTDGSPVWIGTTDLNAGSEVTFPLPGGRWSGGTPVRVERASAPARFAPGASLSLSYWHDVAVDPRLIPRGSSIFVPSYCGTPSRGWFTAADTGGAIIGRHLDVFRAPPSVPWSSGVRRNQRVYVVPPGRARPAALHC